MTIWDGEFTDAYFAQPAPDPAMFGMPTEDDGGREDPLLSRRALGDHRLPPRRGRAPGRPDPGRDRGRRGVGRQVHRAHRRRRSRRCSASQPTVFPSHHGGFNGGDGPLRGQAGRVRGPAARGARRGDSPLVGGRRGVPGHGQRGGVAEDRRDGDPARADQAQPDRALAERPTPGEALARRSGTPGAGGR